jgi:cation:H+ antiporter
MTIWTLILFALGLALLIGGAELLVRGAARLATAFGISPLVVGLTVVAFGTSSPELAVSVQAGLAGQSQLALSNVVGSNIFNVLFILGISAMIAPLVVAQQLVRLDVPLVIGVSILVYLMALDGTISRLNGLLLFSGIVIYIIFAIRKSRRESAQVAAEYEQEFGATESATGSRLILQLGQIIVGLALLVLGSRWLVDSAIVIAQTLGVSEVIVGLTIIAAGTSLPEVATSVVASLRGERDIAVGNVVGSNLFNLLAILGAASLVTRGGLPVAPSLLNFDLPVMVAVALACLPIFFTGNLIARWEGVLFFGYYILYTIYLLLSSTQHDALPAFSNVMLLFVLPLTAVTLGVLWARAAHRNRQPLSRKRAPKGNRRVS